MNLSGGSTSRSGSQVLERHASSHSYHLIQLSGKLFLSGTFN